jgi:hypothetical protein
VATVPVPFTWVAGSAPTAAALNGSTGPKGGLDFLLSPPRATLYMSSSVSLSNNTWTLVTWDGEYQDEDTSPMHSTSSNTSRLTAITPGRYEVSVRAYFAANATGTRGINVTPNGAGTRDVDNAALSDSFWAAANSTNQLVTATFEWLASANDYIELWVIQSSGGALNLVGSGSWTKMSMRWVASS